MRSLAMVAAPLACVLALPTGCGNQRARAAAEPATSSAPEAPVPTADPPARGVPRVLIFAAPETIRLFPDEPAPQPTAEYPSLEAVRDTVGAILGRAADPADTAFHVTRAPARFGYRYVADSTSGWAFHVVVTDTSACPSSHVEKELGAAGWVADFGYSADGPDGGEIGYVSRDYLCVIDARWDGGDDSDSTYVPEPGCEVTVTCVRRRSDDVPPKY